MVNIIFRTYTFNNISLDKKSIEKSGLLVRAFLLLPSQSENLGICEFEQLILTHLLRFVEGKTGFNFMGLVIKETDEKIQKPSLQCFPLFSYIKALDFPTVNLLR